MSASCGHEHASDRLSPAALNRALAEAEARLTEQGQKLTPPRRRVLELLLAEGEPVKAYDLINRFGAEGQAAKPPTVYRALEFLEKQGLAHRIASISAFVACHAGEGEHAAAFLICDCCGASSEVAAPPMSALSAAAEAAGYALERTTIEGHGRCAACRVSA